MGETVMRLNAKAKSFLTKEINREAESLGFEVQKDIVLKRLNQLAQEKGKPLGKEDLAEQVTDMFPTMADQTLTKAAKLNTAQQWRLWLTTGGVMGAGLVGFMGLIWLVNLPYPMVRRPVARVAPMLLLPSYLNMDRNYREAIAHGEQADQLVNNATSAADIELGAEKVRLAQQNLDQLPVWFLGYEPVKVCQFMGGCSWNFTFDEFQRARAQVGRMEARIFQEKNALSALTTAEQNIQTARASYEQATIPEQRQAAIKSWQGAINELTLIPEQTLAGSQTTNRLRNYEQEFQQAAGLVAGTNQTQTMVMAAQQFAQRADQTMAQAPLTVNQWQEVLNLYQEAIQRLQTVQPQDAQYLSAQTFLAEYTETLGKIRINLAAEQGATAQFDQAQAQIQNLLTNLPASNDSQGRNRIKGEISQIISQLQKVQPGTTVYDQAQTLINQAQSRAQQL
ncbi:hypothetical protein [Synechocystis sp. CACIAM 05]|uniref:hypothetical protein n=1 Tax=Synechocystis sp. CACIAM 05 TaxID=1933929 RepID=UPI00138E657F|nr:hypothetical protein [Synechocystis sp. CACIAM 05]QHU99930.1 hypothetical protein BWK47_07130 [Synechocystis sp. CACIAM 05]